MKVVSRLLLACNLAFFAAVVWLISVYGAVSIRPGMWEYKDLVSVLLTVVSIIVTAIGIIIAIAAIWGYQSLKGVAEQKAEEISRLNCDIYLQSDDFRARVDVALKTRLENEAKEAVQNALSPVVLASDAAPEFQQGDSEWHD